MDGTEPLPTVMHGASVALTDSLGTARLAGLTHVRSNAIGFIVTDPMPVETGPGTVRRMGAASTAFSFETTAVATGLSSANFNGTGPARASGYRAAENGEIRAHPSADFDIPAANRTAVLASLGQETDSVNLCVLGTGMRGWMQELTATIAGRDVEISHS